MNESPSTTSNVRSRTETETERTASGSSSTTNDELGLQTTGTSTNSLSATPHRHHHSRRDQGSSTPRSPSTSSYMSTTSVTSTKSSSKKTRSLRPPTWRAGTLRDGGGSSVSMMQLRSSTLGSFETSSKAKAQATVGVVTSASEPSVSLINAESFPSSSSFPEDEGDHYSNTEGEISPTQSSSTVRPRERRGRMDSSASLASLSMYISNSSNWTGVVEGKGKGKGKMTYGYNNAGNKNRGADAGGEGRRRLMELFNDQEERAAEETVAETLTSVSEPVLSATSTDSSDSTITTASDTPTVTLTGAGTSDIGETETASITSAPKLSDSPPTISNHDIHEIANLTSTTAASGPTERYDSNSTNQPNDNALPNLATDSNNSTRDNTSDSNNIASNTSNLDSSPALDGSFTAQAAEKPKPSQVDTTVPSSSASWFGSLGRMMGRGVDTTEGANMDTNNDNTQPQAANETPDLESTPRLKSEEAGRRLASVQSQLGGSSTSSTEPSHIHTSATTSGDVVQSPEVLEPSLSDKTVKERTTRDQQPAKTVPTSRKSWFFTSSPTPPETEATTVSGASTATISGATDAISALVASTHPKSRSHSTFGGDKESPPPSASTAASSFPSSPLTSASFPSSIDDEVPVPKLVLAEALVRHGDNGMEGDSSTIRPRPLQRLRVLSMHKQIGLAEQARIGVVPLVLGPSNEEASPSEGRDQDNSSSGEASSSSLLGEGGALGKDSSSLKTNGTMTVRAGGQSPRQPTRKRINSLNSLNPSTSRFSIVGVPLSFWGALSPGPGPGRSGEKGMDTKSHADTNAPRATTATNISANSSATPSSGATSSTATASVTGTSISTTTNSNSKSSTPFPTSVSTTLTSKSGPVAALSTDTITTTAPASNGVDANATNAKGELVRIGSIDAVEGSQGEPREEIKSNEAREVEGEAEPRNDESLKESATALVASAPQTPETVNSTNQGTATQSTTMEPTTYKGSWWDYVGWTSPASASTVANPPSAALMSEGAADDAGKNAEESKEVNSGVLAETSSPVQSADTNQSVTSTASVHEASGVVPPVTAPAQLEPSPPEADVPSVDEIKSAPPTVPTDSTKPPRAASVFSGETVRSGAASWLAPWTWYGTGSSSALPSAVASSTSVDRGGSKLKRQMTESEKVKEEALARDRERETDADAGADADAEKDGQQGAETTDVARPEESDNPQSQPTDEARPTSVEQPASHTSPALAKEESTNTSLTSPASRSGWASLFSLTGKGKEAVVKPDDGNNGTNKAEDAVKRDENGMEVMDLDLDDDEGTSVPTAAAAAGANETKEEAASKEAPTIDAVKGKEVVRKETMQEILKAGATSPERKVSLMKALLQTSSSPKPASILSSSSSPANYPVPESPTKPSFSGGIKDQVDGKGRGRTDSIVTTATTTSNASDVARRAPLLVVSDDVKAKAAAKALSKSSSNGKDNKEKDKSGSGSGGEPSSSDGRKVEKKSSNDPVKAKERKKEEEKLSSNKDLVKEKPKKEKEKEKERRSKSKSKPSGSGSSTPAPPPPNLVLPTWQDTFYTTPRSHLPSGVVPIKPLPGTEAYEALHGKGEQRSIGSTLGRTMKYVSGVLFSGDRSSSGGEKRKSPSLFRGGSSDSLTVFRRRGSSESASSISSALHPEVGTSGPVSPRIAALRAGSSSGGRFRGGSARGAGSTELEKLKEKEAEVDAERRREKERLYWDWGRSLPRAWEVVEYGQPVGLWTNETKQPDEKDLQNEEMDEQKEAGEDSKASESAIPGMGLEPGTTLSLPADLLGTSKNKGKEKAIPEIDEAVPDVLRGCKKVVVIGIHGWFPGAVIKSVLGEPTGTSAKFVNMTVQALEQFQSQHNVRLDKITKIPLEGEGTIDRRVEKLYTNLLANQQWMDDLHDADAIFVATHSQGSVVSTHLIDRLIRERHIRTSKNGTTQHLSDIGVTLVPLPPQRICCLALCGIHLGPLRYLSTSTLVQPYIQYFESTAARELFEFQNTENDVSKAYVKALRNVVDNGTKMVYVASLNDQVVPIYSGLFTSVSHPLILRALYIDGDAYHSSDFLSNLLVLLLRVLNCGLSDSGLLAHLSEVTAGSLNGVGHSTAYEELATFSLAVNYLFLTNDGFEEHPELTLEPFNASAEMNDYEIPWALRDLIADERVAHFFSQEITDLRNAFREWNPKTSILRDIKRKLQPIQRLPSTLAPGSANSTSKL